MCRVCHGYGTRASFGPSRRRPNDLPTQQPNQPHTPHPTKPQTPNTQERLYRLAGGDVERYEEHQSYISVTFMTLNTNGIHAFFRSLLA